MDISSVTMEDKDATSSTSSRVTFAAAADGEHPQALLSGEGAYLSRCQSEVDRLPVQRQVVNVLAAPIPDTYAAQATGGRIHNPQTFASRCMSARRCANNDEPMPGSLGLQPRVDIQSGDTTMEALRAVQSARASGARSPLPAEERLSETSQKRGPRVTAEGPELRQPTKVAGTLSSVSWQRSVEVPVEAVQRAHVGNAAVPLASMSGGHKELRQINPSSHLGVPSERSCRAGLPQPDEHRSPDDTHPISMQAFRNDEAHVQESHARHFPSSGQRAPTEVFGQLQSSPPHAPRRSSPDHSTAPISEVLARGSLSPVKDGRRRTSLPSSLQVPVARPMPQVNGTPLSAESREMRGCTSPIIQGRNPSAAILGAHGGRSSAVSRGLLPGPTPQWRGPGSPTRHAQQGEDKANCKAWTCNPDNSGSSRISDSSAPSTRPVASLGAELPTAASTSLQSEQRNLSHGRPPGNMPPKEKRQQRTISPPSSYRKSDAESSFAQPDPLLGMLSSQSKPASLLDSIGSASTEPERGSSPPSAHRANENQTEKRIPDGGGLPPYFDPIKPPLAFERVGSPSHGWRNFNSSQTNRRTDGPGNVRSGSQQRDGMSVSMSSLAPSSQVSSSDTLSNMLRCRGSPTRRTQPPAADQPMEAAGAGCGAHMRASTRTGSQYLDAFSPEQVGPPGQPCLSIPRRGGSPVANQATRRLHKAPSSHVGSETRASSSTSMADRESAYHSCSLRTDASSISFGGPPEVTGTERPYTSELTPSFNDQHSCPGSSVEASPLPSFNLSCSAQFQSADTQDRAPAAQSRGGMSMIPHMSRLSSEPPPRARYHSTADFPGSGRQENYDHSLSYQKRDLPFSIASSIDRAANSMSPSLLQQAPRGTSAAGPRKDSSHSSRFLKEALEQGASASVIRSALRLVLEDGRTREPAIIDLVTHAERLLPFVDALETAIASGDPESIRRAIAEAENNGAGAHTHAGRAEVQACEKRALTNTALKKLMGAQSAQDLENALALARGADLDNAILERYEVVLLDMRREVGSVSDTMSYESGDLDTYHTALAEMRLEKTQRAAELEASFAQALEAAMRCAHEAGVETSVLTRFQDALSVMRTGGVQVTAQDALQKAQGSRGLAKAMHDARVAGVEPAVMSAYDVKLHAMGEAEANLRSAIESRSTQQLRNAITSARHVEVNHLLLARAEAVLVEEEPRSRLRTELQRAAHALLEFGSNLPQDIGADRAACCARLRSLIEQCRAANFSEGELSRFEEISKQFESKTTVWLELCGAVAEARTLDIRTVGPERLSVIKHRLFAAVASAVDSGLPEEVVSSAEQDRRRLHNAVLDRRGAVRVFCRIRPLSVNEIASNQTEVIRRRDAFSVEVDAGILDRDSGGVFEFDACWAPGMQQEVFEDTADLVQSAVDGYNVTILAYGQTGAGKTYTMYGHEAPEIGLEARGICPRAVEELFHIVDRESSRREFEVSVSMIELYCRRFVDLLDLGGKKSLKIRTSQNGDVFFDNVHEETVKCAEQVQKLMDDGLRGRHLRDTQMNMGSSRSHLLCCIKVSSVSRESGKTLQGKLLLVDLAGSERVKRSEVTGDGLREACEINLSLSALADVIQAVVHGEAHVPYRNHELTQIMQDSLGGTSKTLMFVNLSPASSNRDESLMSLKYAQRVKGITNITLGEDSRKRRTSSRGPSFSA